MTAVTTSTGMGSGGREVRGPDLPRGSDLSTVETVFEFLLFFVFRQVAER